MALRLPRAAAPMRMRAAMRVRRHATVADREREALSQLTDEKRAHIQSLIRERNAYSAERVEPFRRYLGMSQSLEPGETVDLSKAQIAELLESCDGELVEAVFQHADSVTRRFFGEKIHFRGLIEFSNVCRKNCGYCGIRHDADAHRYTMLKREIVEQALWAFENGYGSVMLQSGELPTEQRTRSMVHIVREIKRRSSEAEAVRTARPAAQCRGLGVALSLGELPSEHYRALFAAGAHRYLLRIESSSPELYARLHPPDHRWERRLACLRELKRIGFQVGTGVMIGLPSQTADHLAADVRFFRDFGADMIGMGPYVLQEGTPVGEWWLRENPDAGTPEGKQRVKEHAFETTTRMLALTRIVCGNVSIAATTALQAINPGGRELAISRGANLMMPILTPIKYREDYQLYENKPCIDEGADECRGCLTMRIRLAGKEIAWDEWGDPPHYFGEDAVCKD